MSAIRDSLNRIAEALERLVALEERKVQAGKKVLDIAARQQCELAGRRPVVELVESENEPGPV